MYKVIFILDNFFLKYEGGDQIAPPPQEKLPSKSPALLGFKMIATFKFNGGILAKLKDIVHDLRGENIFDSIGLLQLQDIAYLFRVL